jgi:hypothetical protein
MRTRRSYALVTVVLVLSLSALTCGSFMASDDFYVFLPIALRNYPIGPCLPVFDEDRLLLIIDTDAGLERLRTADLNGDGWTDVIVARLIFQTATTHEISVLLNDQPPFWHC